MSWRASRSAGWEQTILVCVLIGTAQMTWGVVVPVLPVYVTALHIPVAALGPIIAAFAIGRVVANIPAGLLLVRLRPRPLLGVVLALLAIVTAATGFVHDPAWIVGFRLAAGVLGGAAVTVGFSVLLAGAPAAQRGRVVAVATIVQMGAAAAGALLGGVAVTLTGVTGAFIAASVPVLLALGWDLLRPASGYWSATAAPPGSPDLSSSGSRMPLLLSLTGVSFALFFARFAGEQGLVPVLAYGAGGLDPIGLGLALAGGTVASMIALPLVGRAVDRGARIRVLVPSAIAAGLSLVLLGIASSPWPFALLVVVYGIATSLANVVPGVVTAEAYPGRRTGGVVGVTRTAGDVGAAVGPLVVFSVADAAGPVPALFLTALVLIIAIVAFAIAARPRWSSSAGRSPTRIETTATRPPPLVE